MDDVFKAVMVVIAGWLICTAIVVAAGWAVWGCFTAGLVMAGDPWRPPSPWPIIGIFSGAAAVLSMAAGFSFFFYEATDDK